MTRATLTMPARAPLDMPTQNLRACPDPEHRAPKRHPLLRSVVFIPAFIATGLLLWGLYGLLEQAGMSGLEYLLLVLIGLTFVWVTLSVSTAVIGLWFRSQPAKAARQGAPMRVALLVPVYNEDPVDVFGNARAMLGDLTRQGGSDSYALFILSDTQDPEIAAAEERAFETLHRGKPEGIGVYYRRRQSNTDKKVGNLVDWITGWGAAYDAMVVLDADSLMSGQAIARLTNELAADPEAGLIQSFPQLLASDTVFGRVQQFSHAAYGWLLAEGLAAWAQTEGNYWGHNAIIRTRAFAMAAGLPHLRRGGLILSHDFVEASLLRRAGWRVRFMPRIGGSFEEAPGTLIDYVLRDARWCRGNLQHLRLLGTAGLHPVSRFHLFQGAAAYLMSPAWFVLLIFWALLGRDAETNVVRYFSEENPLFPSWPPSMTHIDSAVFLLVMYAMLLAPKITGAGIIFAHVKASRVYGGRLAFLSGFLVELALSVAYAPIMMIQQTKAVLRSLVSRARGWAPQRRHAHTYPLRTLVAFHWLETVLGVLLFVGLSSGLVSWWLAPIMTSLALAIPLSALSGLRLHQGWPKGLRMETPQSLREPAILRRARTAREEIAVTISAE